MKDIRAIKLFFEIAVYSGDEIFNFRLIRLHLFRRACVGNIRRANQRLIALIGVDENHAFVMVLHQIGLLPLPEFGHDNMAAFNQSYTSGAVASGHSANDIVHPRTSRIDEQFSMYGSLLSAVMIEKLNRPFTVLTPRARAAGAGVNFSTLFGCIKGIQNNQSRIVYPAIRILESFGVLIKNGRPFGITAQIERTRAG